MKHPLSNACGRRPYPQRSLASLAICLVALLAAMSTLRLVADEPASDADDSDAPALLLLKNGNLLEGRVTQQGAHYYVASPGGKLRIRASEAVAACRDVAEAYRLRRQLLQPTVVYDYLALANWCIRHRLYEQAAFELDRAEQVDPGHPRIVLLRKRLELARRPVISSGHAAPTVERGPTVDDLEKMVRSMPAGTVEYFAGRVQPLLVNSCATSACHGPDANSRFRLTRIPAHRPPSRRVTQRNLYNTLQWVDNEHPAKSPLLTVPTRPHGPTRIVLFPDTSTRRYQQLVAWVYSVARRGGARVLPPGVPLANAPAPRPGSRGYQAFQQPANSTEAAALQQAIYEGRPSAEVPGRASSEPGPAPAQSRLPQRFAPASVLSARNANLHRSDKKSPSGHRESAPTPAARDHRASKATRGATGGNRAGAAAAAAASRRASASEPKRRTNPTGSSDQ